MRVPSFFHACDVFKILACAAFLLTKVSTAAVHPIAEPFLSAFKTGEHWLLEADAVAGLSKLNSGWKLVKTLPKKARDIAVLDNDARVSIRNPHEEALMIRFGADDNAYIVAPRSTETFERTALQDFREYSVHPIPSSLYPIRYIE